ncbi:glycosyltransferase [Proteus mirabilis]|uniref:glycosyltransferase n=1 Tax=Proteus mirabilis TaxID=584 RepID=UPI002348FB22|nr:glycosyltransferase [Proteus mirabilis]MDC5973691.1 glycosyltransferase [Proteus mirabilis]
MNIKILVLDITALGGIERVALNMKDMLTQDLYFDSVEIISVTGDTSSMNGVNTLKNGSNENKKLYEFAKNLKENTIVLSLYDRFSIKLSIIRKLFNFKFSLYACQHADYFAHPIKTRILRYITYQWVDKIISLTKQDAVYYKKKFKNVYTIPNALGYYPLSVKKFNNREIDCAAAGRLVPIKQFEHYISLLEKIYNCGYGRAFRIHGEGPEYSALKNKILGSNLRDLCILSGKSKNIYQELNNTKFFFVTSERESFSMVILEAMACGCVVISYDCPTGPRELIENNINGILIPLNDQLALINKYKELLHNPELCQKISDNARAYSKKFLSSKILINWKFIFNEK